MAEEGQDAAAGGGAGGGGAGGDTAILVRSDASSFIRIPVF